MDRWLKMGSLVTKRKSENEDNVRKKNKLSEEEQLVNSGVVCTDTDIQSEREKEGEKRWPEVWTAAQWTEFKGKYVWLNVGENGKLGCGICSCVKKLGVSKEERIRISEEWSHSKIEASGSNRASQLSSLRNKIKKHNESDGHKIASKIKQESQTKSIEEGINKLVSAAEDATTKVFQTAYYLAKKNRPFSDHEDLIRLQQINGINIGSILHSRYSATNIINLIAREMKNQLVLSIIARGSKFSVLIDESTSLSNKSTLVVYIRVYLGGETPNYVFFDLIELDCQDAEHIECKLLNCLKAHGFHEEYLRENWIAIATDGASVMLGKCSGVVTRLKQKYPQLFSWHCLNHRLELSVSDAVNDVRGIDHFKAFMDKLYSLYSQSPKQSRALEEACRDLGVQFLKVGRVLGMRWVASTLRTLKAVWTSFGALYLHFSNSLQDCKIDSNLKATFRGLQKRLASPEFLLDLGVMYDVLQELAVLSKELQSQQITLPRADHLVKRTIRVIESFKNEPGEHTQLALNAAKDGVFQNVILEHNRKIIPINANQFIQSVADRMRSRLCSENDQLLRDISVLDPAKITKGNIRYGEQEIKRICRRFHLDETSAIQGLRDLADNPVVTDIPENMLPVLRTISTLPCSTAECERGFSLMNNIITDLRSSLLITNVSSLMFINSNGPPVSQFKPQKYVKLWLQNHRTATDTNSRICAKSFAEKCRDVSKEALWSVFD